MFNNFQKKNKLISYIQNLKNVPLLSRDEEYILAKNFKDKNDINSAKKLVESNLNYVIKIAKNYQGYGIIIKDLIQVGVIGLMKAVKNFDPNKEVRLISFAIYWIKSEMHEYIIKNLRIVKTTKTKNQRKLFFNFKKIKKIGLLNKKEKDIISNLLNVEKKEIDYIETHINKNDISINYLDDKIDDIFIKNTLLHNKEDPLTIIEKQDWIKYFSKNFNSAFKKLDLRSQEILRHRLLLNKKYTLKELSAMYNLSSERIRQLEKSALNRLKIIISKKD